MYNNNLDFKSKELSVAELLISASKFNVNHPNDSTFLDTLAQLACQKSPIKSQLFSYDSENDFPKQRPRAYSESYISDSSWKNLTTKSTTNDDINLPYIFDQYSTLYNKNGRIGIYTKEERRQIILRFREKKNKRIWRKKIRYFCRKNLADSRIRVKGRFVKKELNSVLKFKEKSNNDGVDNYISSDDNSETESKSENKESNTTPEIASDINEANLNELKNSNKNLSYSSKSSDDPLYIFPQEKRIRRHSIAY